VSGTSLVKPLAFPFQSSIFARLSCSIYTTVRRFKSLGVTTDTWVHGARGRTPPVLAARTGATASCTSQLVPEEAVVFAVFAETLRGTLPR
jgi:hypothetical protein